MVSDDQLRDGIEVERARLQRIAARILGEADAAQDVVQQAWLRLHASDEPIANLAGWLTTVTSRLCLDRLRARTPVPTESIEVEASAIDPADDVVLADTVGIALQVVLDRLTPAERVAFVLHDSFGVDFDSIASMLDTTPVAARKMASRARAKVRPATPEDALADWEIVDAFMAAARQGTSPGCSSYLRLTWWSPPTPPQACLARRRVWRAPMRWPASSTALLLLPSQSSWRIARAPPGSTAAR